MVEHTMVNTVDCQIYNSFYYTNTVVSSCHATNTNSWVKLQ